MGSQIIRTERGWAGHFCAAHLCLFRRNTLLQYKDINVVVSSVGLMRDSRDTNVDSFLQIGGNRYYETMVFHAEWSGRYWDADVSRQIYFENNWQIAEIDADDRANDMHESIVCEIMDNMKNGKY